MLSGYFNDISSFFKKVPKGEDKTFNNYFDQAAYIDNFRGTDAYEFAKIFAQSASFSYFCDKHMDDDLSNYQLFQNIESNGTDYEDVDRIGKKLYDKKLL